MLLPSRWRDRALVDPSGVVHLVAVAVHPAEVDIVLLSGEGRDHVRADRRKNWVRLRGLGAAAADFEHLVLPSGLPDGEAAASPLAVALVREGLAGVHGDA